MTALLVLAVLGQAEAEVPATPTPLRVIEVDWIERNTWVRDNGTPFEQYVFYDTFWDKTDRTYHVVDRGWTKATPDMGWMTHDGNAACVYIPDRNLLVWPRKGVYVTETDEDPERNVTDTNHFWW